MTGLEEAWSAYVEDVLRGYYARLEAMCKVAYELTDLAYRDRLELIDDASMNVRVMDQFPAPACRTTPPPRNPGSGGEVTSRA